MNLQINKLTSVFQFTWSLITDLDLCSDFNYCNDILLLLSTWFRMILLACQRITWKLSRPATCDELISLAVLWNISRRLFLMTLYGPLFEPSVLGILRAKCWALFFYFLMAKKYNWYNCNQSGVDDSRTATFSVLEQYHDDHHNRRPESPFKQKSSFVFYWIYE